MFTEPLRFPIGLGLATELGVIALEGTVLDQGSHAVARWPQLPSYYWGNTLFFPQPPRPANLRPWCRLFVESFQGTDCEGHVTFAWASETGQLGARAELEAAGFSVFRQPAMRLGAPTCPPRANTAVTVRPLQTDAEWARAAWMVIADGVERYDPEVIENFERALFARYRALVEADHGVWLGAFAGGELVASLGLLQVAPGVVRYQSVATVPAWRRKGVSSRLVFEAARIAQEQMGASVVVICPDEDSTAERIYTRIGFRRHSWVCGALRHPPGGPGSGQGYGGLLEGLSFPQP